MRRREPNLNGIKRYFLSMTSTKWIREMQFTVPQLWRLNSIISTKCSLWVLRWTGKMAQINPCHGLHSIGAMSIGGWWRMKPFRHRIHIQRLCSWTIQCLLSLFIFLFVRDIAKYSIYNYIYICIITIIIIMLTRAHISWSFMFLLTNFRANHAKGSQIHIRCGRWLEKVIVKSAGMV